MRAPAAIAAILCLLPPAVAQDRPTKPPPEPIPSEVFLADLHEAYSAPFAEEITIRVHTPSGDRSDTLTIRVDPGLKRLASDAGPVTPRPRCVLFELGQLRISIAEGKLTATNSAAPDKFFQRSFPGPITPARLAEVLPPLPIPQLAIVNPEDPGFNSPLELLRKTVWSDALVDEAARPLTITMKGLSPAGSISITALVSTVRLTKISASIHRPDAEAQFEFSFKAVDPGDPTKWALPTEGRQSVPSLTDLRTTPKPISPPPPVPPAASDKPLPAVEAPSVPK